MAMYPCDVNDRRYNGPQQTIYPAIVDGLMNTRRKLRLCPTHFDAYMETLSTRANNAQLEFEAEPKVRCISCGQEAEGAKYAFFATAYAAKADRVDFWAAVHEACIGAACEDWHITL